MCGLTGFLGQSPHVPTEDLDRTLVHMSGAIAARGPDASGVWSDSEVGIGLAHRRLAILEPSAAGAQPMHSHSGRYVVAFNGEIYNHMDLRNELQIFGHVNWRGQSDTETLVEGFARWGVEGTLRRANGMFAFALWDRKERVLTLGRDRVGEKPLYYGWQGKGPDAIFLFGSDLSALRRHPAFRAAIDRDALALFLRHNYIGGAHSIYTGMHKLLPGHILSLSCKQREPILHQWWSVSAVACRGIAHPFLGSPEEAVDQLEALIRTAVKRQMVADVPVGAFLSGGIDSSTIVALMQEQSARSVKTFSIGFNERGYNEAQHAKAVASHLGTDHTDLYVTAQHAIDVLPQLPRLYSEPFADASQIPTFLVSQLARQQVTVSLSGDGGDELFGGYPRHRMTTVLWNKALRLPPPIRAAFASAVTSVPAKALDCLGSLLSFARTADKFHKGAILLRSNDLSEFYRRIVSHSHDPASIVIGCSDPYTILSNVVEPSSHLGAVDHIMALDMLSFLPDGILTKLDRASMGVSLETRIPLLDHRVVEFAWSLPIKMKLRRGVAKWPLRQVLYRHVPQSLVERPKMGFSVPIDAWLRGPMRDWAESLLCESRLRNEGYFDPIPIRRKWEEHLKGERNWQHHLWGVLMAQSWLEAQKDEQFNFK